MENYFILLELSFDPIETDENIVDIQIVGGYLNFFLNKKIVTQLST